MYGTAEYRQELLSFCLKCQFDSKTYRGVIDEAKSSAPDDRNYGCKERRILHGFDGV